MLHLLRAGGVALAGLGLAAAGLALPAAADDVTTPYDGPALSAAQEALLASDDAVDVADDGTLFVRDAWQAPDGDPQPAATTARAAASPAAALGDTFALHSRPGATRTIYLDFDGGTLLSTNSWLLEGLATLLFPGWSMDSSPAFSDAERAVVQEVWARVAEDYAPFDIDVTTEEPPPGGLWRSSAADLTYGTRVAFTSGNAIQRALCGGGCGGVAWIGTFDSVTIGETRSPAWVFPSSLGNSAKNLAEAASHEAGHNLGLDHDGTTSSGYYAGTSLWGPIMGSPYAAAVTQWSRGDYANANNRQDDVAVIQSHGVPLVRDEAGDSPATAASPADLPGGTGVISSRSDVDWYAVTSCSGTVSAQAAPVAVGPDLDVRLEVRDADGGLLAAHAPATTRTSGGLSGMGASVSTPLTGGPYYLVVSGVGSGAGGVSGWSSGGYDDYGSLGTYRLSVSGCTGGVVPPPEGPGSPGDPGPDDPVAPPPLAQATRPGTPRAPVVARGARGGRLTVTARWTPPATGGAALTGYVVRAYRLDARGRVVGTARKRALPASATSVALRLPKGRWTVRVKARNRVSWSALSPRSAVVRPR